MAKKNLRSDAAYRRFKEAAMRPHSATIASVGETETDVIVYLGAKARDAKEWHEAEISINDIIAKRKPLKGIKAVLSGKSSTKKRRK